MARVAITLLCAQDDPLAVRHAVASLASRLDVLTVGPLREGAAAVVVRTRVGPPALARLLRQLSTAEIRMEILSYGALIYRGDELTLPSPYPFGLDSLAEADPAFEIPQPGIASAHLEVVSDRRLL